MKKIISVIVLILFIVILAVYAQPEEEISTNKTETSYSEADGVADYPAAIMVESKIYLLNGQPMSAEIDESAIIGYTTSYTEFFPEKNGETNFNKELEMPYAKVEGGIAVLYENEWYLCTFHER